MLELICTTFNFMPDILFSFEKLASSNEEQADEIVDIIKDKPELVKIMHKVASALNSKFSFY